jgi:Predicted exonuclease
MELREKLRLALAAAPVLSAASLHSPAARPRTTHTNLQGLPAQLRLTDLGEVYVAEERWPLEHRHGDLALSAALAVGETAVARLAPGLDPSDLERVAFLDVETTGLAGGTGTLAFLVGVATFESEGLCLRQFFLASPGGEEALLTELSRVLEGCRAIVSFNGRCFDVPLLESRFVLNRLRPPFGRMEHVDLLFAARRLYSRRLGSCRLGEVEESILGVRRESDVPGWAVPRIYFEYLRYGTTEPLIGVFLHNKLDVLSLVTLLGRIGGAAGGTAPDDPHLCLALARWDEARGRFAEADALYRTALGSGSLGEDGAFALRRLLSLLRRFGSWEQMEQMLTEALQVVSPACCRVEALVELAKFREHRCRDFAAAEELTREAIALSRVTAERSAACELTRGALDRRLARLLRRRRKGDLRPQAT